jgi:cell division septation protein DedD
MAKTAAGGSKADTAVKLVLIFFISLLSFTVGTLVGGQFEKSKSHQMTLETGSGHDAAAQEELADTDASPISNEEIEGLEEFVKADSKAADEEAGRNVASVDEHSAPAHGEAAPAAGHGKEGYTHASQIKEGAPAPVVKNAPTVKAAAHSVATAAERVATDKAPAADPKKVREPAKSLPLVASSTIGKFTVQVASYATEKEATNHATKLKDKGFNAFFIPATVNGKTWYRVSVGRFEDQKTATAYRKELLDAQATTSAIVQKVIQ